MPALGILVWEVGSLRETFGADNCKIEDADVKQSDEDDEEDDEEDEEDEEEGSPSSLSDKSIPATKRFFLWLFLAEHVFFTRFFLVNSPRTLNSLFLH